MVTVTLTDFIQAANGVCRLRWSDGTELEFTKFSDLQAWTLEAETVDAARKLCTAYAIARSPTLSNIASVRNKNFILDLSAAQPIKVQ